MGNRAAQLDPHKRPPIGHREVDGRLPRPQPQSVRDFSALPRDVHVAVSLSSAEGRSMHGLASIPHWPRGFRSQASRLSLPPFSTFRLLTAHHQLFTWLPGLPAA